MVSRGITALTQLFSGESLQKKAMRSASWATIGHAGQSALRILSNLALTRLLTPDVFGLMALALAVQQGISFLSDVGTQPSVIRSKQGAEPAFYQTAWSVQILRGCAIMSVMCLIAWPAASLYNAPELFAVMLVLSLTAAIGGFQSISIALQHREFMLKRLTVLQLSVKAVATLVTIVAAWILESVWALVIGALIGSLLYSILSHTVLQPVTHRFRLDRTYLREILVFGRWILLGSLFTYLGGSGISLIQGMLVPLEVVGFLVIASIWAWAPGELIMRLMSSTAFPALSQVVRERPEDLQRVVDKINRIVALSVIPGFIALSLIAQPFIDLLYDPRYADAGLYLGLMALTSAISVLSTPYQNAMLALGHSGPHAVVMGVSAGSRILGVVAGFWLGDVIGMLIGSTLSVLVTLLVSVLIIRSYGLRVSWWLACVLVAILATYLYKLSLV